MNIANWSIRDAIQERVTLEDLCFWAQTPNNPTSSKILTSTKWKQTPLRAFVSSILP